MSVCEPEGGYPALNTYFELGERGQQPSTPLNVLIPPFFRQTYGLGQSLMLITLRGDRANLADIASAVGIDPFLGGH